MSRVSHIKIFRFKSVSNQKIKSNAIAEERANYRSKSLKTQMELTIRFNTCYLMIKLKSELVIHFESRNHSDGFNVAMTLKVFFPQFQNN